MDAPTTSYVRALNGYYSRPDFFRTDVEKGTIRTPTGTRVCALTDDFLRGFRTALEFECGKAAERVFKRCGKRWGAVFVARFDRETGEHFGVPTREVSAGLVHRCLGEAFRYHGWGRLNIDMAEYDSGLVQAEVRDPVMPASAPASRGRPSDSLMAGFFSAVFSYYAGIELDCQQTDCPSRGADASRFVVGLPGRLAAVETWVADGLTHQAVLRRLKNPAE